MYDGKWILTGLLGIKSVKRKCSTMTASALEEQGLPLERNALAFCVISQYKCTARTGSRGTHVITSKAWVIAPRTELKGEQSGRIKAKDRCGMGDT
ncbi:hypothetical protein GDO81_003680 [Engystomops pustulosus]|uniref:Uncharacterized protein n=1 Tax=Engystomops pustulosus TaxID=76066 RepID=A0AAV7A3T1_ENGPU|nr:hypothetical protein GDO81_003680 [Engystomops pustulosus]